MTTALFLGRFQPPHVGHLLTIRTLANKFDRLIVGVTEAEPSVMPVSNVIDLLKQLLPEPKISFIHVTGSVEGGTAVIDCEFDVCCSGNTAVLDIMKSKGYQTEYTPRTSDHLFSGTNERRAFISSALRRTVAPSSQSLTSFELINTANLRPIEKVNPRHYTVIEQSIINTGIMQKPLIVDKLTLAVLDGSHRYAFLVKHGYKTATVILCDYDDESVFVGTHLEHRFKHDPDNWISKKHVRATAISGDLYNPRTTRHFFPFRKIDQPTSLTELEAGPPTDIEYLLYATTPDDEIANNEAYIDELEFELKTLHEYADEQQEVKNWLIQQNADILAQND
jgi:cytidyltransferase-like protein